MNDLCSLELKLNDRGISSDENTRTFQQDTTLT